MAGTYMVVGHPVNVAGVWIQAPAPYLSASSGVFVQLATDGLIVVASLAGGAAEASALCGIGNATMIG